MFLSFSLSSHRNRLLTKPIKAHFDSAQHRLGIQVGILAKNAYLKMPNWIQLRRTLQGWFYFSRRKKGEIHEEKKCHAGLNTICFSVLVSFGATEREV